MRAFVLTTGLFAAGLGAASGALAQSTAERQDRLCRMSWEALLAMPEAVGLSGTYSGLDNGWCLFENIRYKQPASTYGAAFEIDTLLLRGEAFGVMIFAEPPPGPVVSAEVMFEGARTVPQTDMARMNYLFAAQARVSSTSGEMALEWDSETNMLTLTKFAVDFPGDNAISLTAKVNNVNLSSNAAMQMSATGFAVTDLSLEITSHGLFENVPLMLLGNLVLPDDGDMEVEAAKLRALAQDGVAALPDASVSMASKDALSQLIDELPNPAGRLTVDMRAESGFGPARLAAFAVRGLPTSVADAAPLFNGVTFDVTWTRQDVE